MTEVRGNGRLLAVPESKIDAIATFGRACGIDMEQFQRRVVRCVLSGAKLVLFLIPRGNGKTTLLALVALHHLLTVRNPQVIIAAASRDQASILFDEVEKMAANVPAIARRIRVIRSKKEIRTPTGKLKVISSDAPRAHGLMPTLIIGDEIHAWEGEQLWTALRTAMGKRPEVQFLAISTAGYDLDGLLYRIREQILEAEDRVEESPEPRCRIVTTGKSILIEWALREDDDRKDAEVVKLANPASFVTVDFLRDQIESPDLHPGEFARFHCNAWLSDSVDEPWIPAEVWDGRAVAGIRPPAGCEVFLAVDVGVRHDATAVAVVWRHEGKWALNVHVMDPADYDGSVPVSDVEDLILDLAERHDVLAVGYDPWSFRRSAELLEDRGLTMIELPQSNERLHMIAANFHRLATEDQFVHDGDPVLRAHSLAAIARDTERGWRLAKQTTVSGRRVKGDPIDAILAGGMALYLATERPDLSVYEERGLLILR